MLFSPISPPPSSFRLQKLQLLKGKGSFPFKEVVCLGLQVWDRTGAASSALRRSVPSCGTAPGPSCPRLRITLCSPTVFMTLCKQLYQGFIYWSCFFKEEMLGKNLTAQGEKRQKEEFWVLWDKCRTLLLCREHRNTSWQGIYFCFRMYLSSKQFNKLSFLVVFKPFLEDSYKLCEKDMYNSVSGMHQNFCCLETSVVFFVGLIVVLTP